MTQLSSAAPPMPAVAPARATDPGDPVSATTGKDREGKADGGIDFATVLQTRIDQPAKQAPAAEIIAALESPQMPEAAETSPPTEALPAAPDLAALLSAHAGPVPPAATDAPPADIDGANLAAGKDARPAAAGAPLVSAASIPFAPATADDAAATEIETVPAAASPLRETGLAVVRQAPSEAVPASPVAGMQMPAAAGEPVHPNAAMHVAAPPAHAAAAGDAPSLARIDTPVGSRGWDAEVGQKVLLMVNRTESRAELTLTPPQLGKLEITLTVSGDQTSAAFVSASPAAREALEQALPRLREMLAEAGITLGQASVNAESAQHGNDGAPAEGRGRWRGADAASGTDAPAQWIRQGRGLIDTFA
ncbi:MAG: flagellar hook-length control protein FliK [Rhodocyclaceae bacterium]